MGRDGVRGSGGGECAANVSSGAHRYLERLVESHEMNECSGLCPHEKEDSSCVKIKEN